MVKSVEFCKRTGRFTFRAFVFLSSTCRCRLTQNFVKGREVPLSMLLSEHLFTYHPHAAVAFTIFSVCKFEMVGEL